MPSGESLIIVQYPKRDLYHTVMRVDSPPNKIEPLEEDEEFSSIDDDKRRRGAGYGPNSANAEAEPRISCPCLPNSVRLTFTSPELEKIYLKSNKRERVKSNLFFAVFAVVVNIVIFIVYALHSARSHQNVLIISGLFCLVFLCLLVANRKSRSPGYNTSSLIWISAALETLLVLKLKGEPLTPSDLAECVTFLAFLAFILLPLRLRFCLVWVLVLVLVYSLVIGFASTNHKDFLGRQVGDILLIFIILKKKKKIQSFPPIFRNLSLCQTLLKSTGISI